MLYDRPYMRAPSYRSSPPYLLWLLGVLGASFLLQSIAQVWFGQGRVLADWFALSASNLLAGKVWTLATYGLLHGGIWHLLMNGLGIFFAGRLLAPITGERTVLRSFIVAVLAGGAVWAGLQLLGGRGTLVGASAGAYGLVILYCLLRPNESLTLLLFFVIPVTVKPKWIGWAAVGINGFLFLFNELPGLLGHRPMVGGVAWSAHLGGMLAGYLYYQYLQRPAPVRTKTEVAVEPPNWLKKKGAAAAGKFRVNLTNRKDLRKEVDRILDKINREGFGALSDDERRVLDRAGDLLKK